MTGRFRDLPIRRKLLVMTLTSSAAALALASAGFLAWDVYRFRGELQEELHTQARVVADASAAPLSFGDRKTAFETLAPIGRSAHVQVVCLYSRDEKLFRAYGPESQCPAKPPAETRIGADYLEVLERVNDRQRRVGLLYIRRDLLDVYTRLRIAAGTVVGLILLAIAAAFLISPASNASSRPRSWTWPTPHARSPAPETTRCERRPARPTRSAWWSTRSTTCSIALANGRRSSPSRTPSSSTRCRSGARSKAERSAALERERDANRLKDEFLATLSHELRTPLNAVLGWTRVLRTARVAPATQARALESIERNARAQARLIEDLLEVSRIVTGKLRLQMEEVDLAAIVDAAVEVVQPAAAAKRLRLIDPSGRPSRDHRGRPRSAAAGRLEPAVERREVHASRRPGLGQARAAATVTCITVRDSGPGIDPKFLPFVFEPFRQADGSASREHGGLGLGLAIAKRLVELHGGTIQTRSAGRRRQAPRSRCTCPRQLRRQPTPPPCRQDRLLAPTRRRPARCCRTFEVLVVDDEEDARVLLETALATYGADVATASSVADALTEIDRSPTRRAAERHRHAARGRLSP